VDSISPHSYGIKSSMSMMLCSPFVMRAVMRYLDLGLFYQVLWQTKGRPAWTEGIWVREMRSRCCEDRTLTWLYAASAVYFFSILRSLKSIWPAEITQYLAKISKAEQKKKSYLWSGYWRRQPLLSIYVRG
jgi:hypothetical protein